MEVEGLSIGGESSKKINNKPSKAPQKKSVQKLIQKTSKKEEKHLIKRLDSSVLSKSAIPETKPLPIYYPKLIDLD